jgi:hypothetical protein
MLPANTGRLESGFTRLALDWLFSAPGAGKFQTDQNQELS